MCYREKKLHKIRSASVCVVVVWRLTNIHKSTMEERKNTHTQNYSDKENMKVLLSAMVKLVLERARPLQKQISVEKLHHSHRTYAFSHPSGSFSAGLLSTESTHTHKS